MKIDFAVEEYFQELKLMEQQYGQEEDLYPWIYMLLQMAECKKQELLKEHYKGVSIRDVHNCQPRDLDIIVDEAKRSILKTLFSVIGGPPDILILDKNSEYFLGCTEIKAYTESLNLQNEVYAYNNYMPGKCEIKYSFNLKEITVDEENNLKEKIKIDLSKNELSVDKVQYKEKQRNVYRFIATIDNLDESTIKKIESLNAERELPNIYGKIKIKYCNWKCNEDLGFYKYNQIVGQLERFNKVLYTNALEFYLLKLVTEESNESKKTIEVKKLANLKECYDDFKQNIDSPSMLLEAHSEWDKLLAGLMGIDWHKDLKAPINSQK